MQILDDLKILKERFKDNDTHFVSELNDWEKQIKADILKADFGDNPAVAELIKRLKGEVVAVNTLLLVDEDLSDIERARLLERRRAFTNLLNFFDEAKTDLKLLHDEIKTNLE